MNSTRFDLAASLGQVHRAVLRGPRSRGQGFQRPDVRERVLKDLGALDTRSRRCFDGSAGHRDTSTLHACSRVPALVMCELDYAKRRETSSRSRSSFGDSS